eukprot:CAMPEP_0171056418 /NCGR_PEP_ID=MMETSP0766_2-20121228/933_1 /TAXON_ID=439317 /ORGANISM="Gambierdiscus australes, Strain CAWD 149" /LENGTH=51 /DNA_ID=CAMNT_0011511317 /DNA_START=71 /DNA_END=223 /DNA_ORIENTATION=+
MARAAVLPAVLAACFCAVLLRCALPTQSGTPAAFAGVHLRSTAVVEGTELR